MAATGRIARGLRKVTGYMPPTPPQPQKSETQEKKGRRRPIRHKLFSLGAGLDMPLLIFILVLLAIGLVMLFSASYSYRYYHYGNSYFFISRHAPFAVAGVIALLLLSSYVYHRFHKLAIVIFGISFFLLVLLLFFPFPHIEQFPWQ